ncbi:hypothetical protein A3H85_01555 [Candidatus Daviesbacteria bacterium RIFCSPLOWO2_02_FULL_40_8]|uniref:Uncharacterized protein n=1 Tax=Candidatus Daviesbacteria bacterium RIFCSPLOWO2_01_FULL_40_24 TaxID=1797787 RepID=A0A1F5MKC9_9BACT|nr:MAG: hypothetical protein A2780_00490 [Candidatus Daviesbacteria bacterium RIFCSPHIGHO2_01_FULL_41_45]OGE34027.1 MAG: hypothetical protein A3C32_00620 [Candidatus Daviesbacteria bacterium RIFCSPHIGHO2_02_FULL_41_14]OGE65831.1 MAG: hypothetical protein A3B49_03465 [Candidatus Daviesbacteria bacterium RIFCSPLOWO2_01_FULL_40_24]OGE66913.1 MAG: hypothetical protein A3H85_01555 [Candidatus Daviesbacteria bacterium RIFCSPLOWO2_02_FULL_40_8]
MLLEGDRRFWAARVFTDSPQVHPQSRELRPDKEVWNIILTGDKNRPPRATIHYVIEPENSEFALENLWIHLNGNLPDLSAPPLQVRRSIYQILNPDPNNPNIFLADNFCSLARSLKIEFGLAGETLIHIRQKTGSRYPYLINGPQDRAETLEAT